MDKKALTQAIEDLQQGNTKAMDKVFRLTNGNLYVYAKYLKGDTQAAEDLLQDTYIAVLKSIHTLKNPGAFLTWSKRIMYHEACHSYARDNKETQIATEESDDFFGRIEDDDTMLMPENRLEMKECSQIIWDTVESLPVDQRMAVVSFYYDNLSTVEIAEIMGVSVNTVKSRIRYGKKKIRSEVEAFQRKNGFKLFQSVPIAALLQAAAPAEMGARALAVMYAKVLWGAGFEIVAIQSILSMGAAAVMTKPVALVLAGSLCASSVGLGIYEHEQMSKKDVLSDSVVAEEPAGTISESTEADAVGRTSVENDADSTNLNSAEDDADRGWAKPGEPIRTAADHVPNSSKVDRRPESGLYNDPADDSDKPFTSEQKRSIISKYYTKVFDEVYGRDFVVDGTGYREVGLADIDNDGVPEYYSYDNDVFALTGTKVRRVTGNYETNAGGKARYLYEGLPGIYPYGGRGHC